MDITKELKPGQQSPDGFQFVDLKFFELHRGVTKFKAIVLERGFSSVEGALISSSYPPRLCLMEMTRSELKGFYLGVCAASEYYCEDDPSGCGAAVAAIPLNRRLTLKP